jgi:hypothetical protein
LADAFLTSLLSGDILGFVVSMYTSSMGQGFYAFVLAIVCGAMYNRTRSMGLLVVLWFLLGGVWITAAAEVSPIAVLLVALGVVGTIFKLYVLSRST